MDSLFYKIRYWKLLQTLPRLGVQSRKCGFTTLSNSEKKKRLT
jgi:hypothetical protein